jgi:hypothetical protein
MNLTSTTNSCIVFLLPDITVDNFLPTAGSNPTFTKNTATTLTDFTINVKNIATAGAGNQIAAATTGDNYAIDIYLAQANLATTPAAIKTAAFPATANAATVGNLKSALAAGGGTTSLTMTASGITLPVANCNKYTWLCAKVKKASGGQYIDSNANNNYQCKDNTAKISCPVGKLTFSSLYMKLRSILY